MESIFKHNGKFYRVDSIVTKKPDYFWGEELEWDDSSKNFEPNENYRQFKISDLINAQAEALNQALK